MPSCIIDAAVGSRSEDLSVTRDACLPFDSLVAWTNAVEWASNYTTWVQLVLPPQDLVIGEEVLE